jgi:hypothetical protein
LVEAFDEMLDLRQHLLVSHGLGGLVDFHHHCLLEVRHGAGYCVHPGIVVGERTAVFGDVGELAPRTLARPLGLLALGPVRPELVTRQRPQSAMRIVPPLADDPERRRSFAKPVKLARIWPRSSPRQHQQNDREKRPHAAEAEQQRAAEPSAIRLPA